MKQVNMPPRVRVRESDIKRYDLCRCGHPRWHHYRLTAPYQCAACVGFLIALGGRCVRRPSEGVRYAVEEREGLRPGVRLA